jgi:murein DD-endopeptidase MepM/ murein hydrolase activator NlpD
MPSLTPSPSSRRFALCLLMLAGSACGCRRDPYLGASPAEVLTFKQVELPFPSGASFHVSQGAFGHFPGFVRDLLTPDSARTHAGKGEEYQWDFDVPFGTTVTAVEAGTVASIWQPDRGGKCNDPAYNDAAHNVKIRHADGTVAVYVHAESLVAVGDSVIAGQKIAETGMSGNLCTPQLHFGVFEGNRSIPLRFAGLATPRAVPGFTGVVP